MILLDRWDVALVPFPFTDRNSVRKRPALVLSERSFNDAVGSTVFAMITKAQFSNWPGDYVVKEWRRAGLLIPSTVRIKLFSIENSLILLRLGHFSQPDEHGFRVSVKPILW